MQKETVSTRKSSSDSGFPDHPSAGQVSGQKVYSVYKEEKGCGKDHIRGDVYIHKFFYSLHRLAHKHGGEDGRRDQRGEEEDRRLLQKGTADLLR